MKLMGHLRHKAAICLSVAAAAWMLAGPGQMPSSRGTVSGRITDREGRPIPGVQVMVAGERSVTVTTDPSGRYRAEGLEPGRYSIWVEKEGYAPLRETGRAAALRLRPGEHLEDVDFRLDREAFLCGLVQDPERRPLVGVRVSALQRVFTGPTASYSPLRTALSNDQGRFCLRGLPPGLYYLVAVPTERPIASVTAPGQKPCPAHSVLRITFYAKSDTIHTAVPIHVSAEESREDILMELLADRGYCVRATLVDSLTGAAPAQATVQLHQQISQQWHPVGFSKVQGAREIHISGLPPGEYRLAARSRDPATNRSAFGQLTFQIFNDNLGDLQLALAPLVQLPVQISLEDSGHEAVKPRVAVAIEPTWRVPFQDEETWLRLSSDAGVGFASLFPDEYWIRIWVADRRYYVSRVRIAGEDVLYKPLVVPPAQTAPVEITLASGAGTVRGTVVDSGDKPVPGAVVALAPATLPEISAPQQIRHEYTDQYGAFEFPNLRPGDYRVAAFLGMTRAQVDDAAFLRAHWSDLRKLQVDKDQVADLKLKVTPPR
jgi:hypothetical protein